LHCEDLGVLFVTRLAPTFDVITVTQVLRSFKNTTIFCHSCLDIPPEIEILFSYIMLLGADIIDFFYSFYSLPIQPPRGAPCRRTAQWSPPRLALCPSLRQGGNRLRLAGIIRIQTTPHQPLLQNLSGRSGTLINFLGIHRCSQHQWFVKSSADLVC